MGGEGGQWGSFVDVVLRLGLVGEMELEQKLSDALVPHQSVRVQAVNTQHNFCCSGRCVRFSHCKHLEASALLALGRCLLLGHRLI